MRDEAITVPPTLTLAQQAVLYLLRRIRLDANLRWYMLHTEAFAKLCAAEAERTGEDADAVMEMCSKMEEHCSDETADVVTLRKKLERIEAVCEDRCGYSFSLLDRIKAILEERP